MKIILTGNLASTKEVKQISKDLRKEGSTVAVSKSLEQRIQESIKKKSKTKPKEKPQIKAIKNYWKAIENADILLVLNNKKKKGIENYIEGKTFLEMGFAHVLSKKIYLLNSVPRVDFKDEIDLMEPVILKGDLSKITK